MFNFIFKNLFRRKTRTLLTVLGIAVGVSMIVALGAIGEGMRSGYSSMFGGSGADLTLMQSGSYDITMSGVDEQAIVDITAVPGIKAATGMIVGNISAPGAAYFFIFGYDPKGFAFEKFRVVEGQALGQARRSAGNVREIMLGKQAAEVLKMKVGDLIRLTGGTFKVVGIYNSGDGFEDAASIVSLVDAQQLLQKHRQVGAVQVKVEDPRQIEALRARVVLARPRADVLAGCAPVGFRPPAVRTQEAELVPGIVAHAVEAIPEQGPFLLEGAEAVGELDLAGAVGRRLGDRPTRRPRAARCWRSPPGRSGTGRSPARGAREAAPRGGRQRHREGGERMRVRGPRQGPPRDPAAGRRRLPGGPPCRGAIRTGRRPRRSPSRPR